MDVNFVLDPNTVKDCAEHPVAAEARSHSHDASRRLDGKMIFQAPEIHQHVSERCDSAYGSECYSSTAGRFNSTTSTGDVSQRLQQMHIEQTYQCVDSKASERIGRPQKRSAETQDEVMLTSDAYDQDEEGDTPLSQSIICEKKDIALKFIRYTPDSACFNIRNCLGQTALMLSVLTHQHDVCRALVVAGASVDIQDKEGNTALHLACAMRNVSCVQALTSQIMPREIKDNVSLRNHRSPQNLTSQLGLKNYDGLTCIHLATFQANIGLLQYLVGLGADINEPDGKSGRTALHYAVEMNNFNLVQSLITTLGANVDAVTFDLCTPLHLAAGRGHVDIAYMLHGARAETQVVNFEGLCAYELTDNAELRDLIMPAQGQDHMQFDY